MCLEMLVFPGGTFPLWAPFFLKKNLFTRRLISPLIIFASWLVSTHVDLCLQSIHKVRVERVSIIIKTGGEVTAFSLSFLHSSYAGWRGLLGGRLIYIFHLVWKQKLKEREKRATNFLVDTRVREFIYIPKKLFLLQCDHLSNLGSISIRAHRAN